MKLFTKKPKPTKQARPKKANDYFTQAKSWADDRYASAIISRHRYQVAFYGAMGLAVILAIALCIAMPLKEIQLMVLYRGASGTTFVKTTRPGATPAVDMAQTRADLARYVQMRESYDPMLYRYQTQLVKWQSNRAVLAGYVSDQTASNPNAPINLLGAKGYRTALVHDVLILDSQSKNNSKIHSHKNLAQIDVTVTSHSTKTGATPLASYRIIMSWTYQGIPTDPQEQLQNFDGFEVTKYVIEPLT